MKSSRELSPQPSTSKAARGDILIEKDDDIDTFPPTMADEEAEIARLEAANINQTENTKDSSEDASKDDEREAKIKFICTACDMQEMVHYFGQSPPFVVGIKFVENTYVMRDPFQPPPLRWKPKPEYFIALGSHCSECDKVVCKDAECSFFYTRTFCLNCGEKQIKLFPPEAQTKLRKQLAAKQKQ